MKRLILITLFGIGVSFTLTAQTSTVYTGTWQGVLKVGVDLKIVFHITSEEDKLTATADSPDQATYGLKCDSVFIKGDSLTINMNALRASFTGKLSDDTTMKGFFTQVMKVPLTLTKTEKTIPAVNNRPQTPVPPFPYRSEDVTYYNKDRSIQFGATLTLPEGKGPFPAIVLISGSGPHNRDAEMMGHKPFAVLADHFTKQGIAVLRADERGVGKSTGEFATATSADFANDISAGVDYLLTRPEINKKKIGLAGHSEGGIVAPMVAVARKDISFLILLAGPGIKNIDLMTEQNIAFLESSGISKAAATAYGELYKNILTHVIESADSAAAVTAARNSITRWIEKTPESITKELDLHTAQKQAEVVKKLLQTIYTPWFRFFIAYDPAPTLEKIKCPVLALNGSKDIQVLPASNLNGIREALKKAGNKKAEIREIPQLNHLFQTCNTCTIQEYNLLTETFSPAAWQLISEWLDKNVK